MEKARTVDLAFAELPGHEMFELLEELRGDGPLARATFAGAPCFLTTTHGLLLEGFIDAAKFPPARLYQNSIARVIGPNFQSMEGARHTLYRRLATPAFRSRAVERYEREGMAELAHELLERLDGRGEADLASAFTHRFPFLVLCRLVGIPRDREDEFHQWAAEMVTPPNVPLEVCRRAAAEFTRYLAPTLAERRREPRSDVISELIAAEVEGRHLTDEEISSHVKLMFSAGATTTCDGIGNLLHAVLSHSGAWEQVVDDPSVRATAVHESLRWQTPVPNLPRISAEETVEFGGREIPPKSFVLFSMASANRDPAVYDDPHRFDPARSSRDILSFGRGERSCPGMHLAKKELSIALDVLIDRFPKLRLQGDPQASAPTGAIIRGPKTLPVALQ
jgi:cytochrome P450